MTEVQDLVFERKGEGIPILVVHGWTMAGFAEALDFEPVFTKKDGYSRIYVDLPGMGKSAANGVKDLDSILDSLSAFVERHILPSKFLLIGSSCGSYLTQALAFKYAGNVDGLLLRVPLVEPDDSKRDIDSFVPAIANEALISSLPLADREQLGKIPVQTRDYIEKLKNKMKDVWVPATELSDSKALDPIRNDPSRYKLVAPMHTSSNTFAKPTLILTGRQDSVVGYRDALPLLECYPRATFALLDRADHGLPIDENNVFEALVGDWLSRVEELRRQAV